MKTYLLLAVCGVVGVYLRYFIHTRFEDFGWPMGTLIVNLLGCLLIGFLYSWSSVNSQLSPQAYLVLSVGLLGALTTFSSFSLDTLKLLQAGQFIMAFSYLLISNVAGLSACYLGTKLGTILQLH